MEEVYFDNAATTRPYDEVYDKIALVMRECYANPSSLHSFGMKAEKEVRVSRSTLAKTLAVPAKDLYFTSGGTESDNISVLGYVHANIKKCTRVVTSQIEHAAVYEPCRKLQEEGVEVRFVGVDADGKLDLEEFEKNLTSDTGLVSVMSVNNETGAIQPISQLKAIMKQKSPLAVLHVDHVQGFTKVPMEIERWGVDLLSMSGHKIHGPKGIGALYVRDKLRVNPVVLGGGQENNLRSGTHSVYDIAGFALAAQMTMADKESEKTAAVMRKARDLIQERIPNIRINTPEKGAAPHVLNVSFLGLRAEVLLHALEAHRIYVSTGSACSSNRPERSRTLLAMGLTREEVDSAIRFSFSRFNTEDEVEYLINILEKEVEVLRKYSGR